MRPRRLRHHRSTAGSAVALVVAVVLAACSTPTPTAEDTGTPTGSASAGEQPSDEPSSSGPIDTATGGTEQSPGLDPAFAVDPPGRFKSLPQTADIVVQAQDTIDEETVEEIAALPGVRSVEQLSMVQVSIENRVLDIAAVDAGSYRRYTSGELPGNQEVWERVAGGELAIEPKLRKRLPLDDNEFVTLIDDAPSIHVGAYASQITNAVDGVVNAKWGEALGATPGNGLLISLGLTDTPERVLEPLTELLPKRTSIERLDAVARYGLDPDAFQTATVVGTFAQAVGTFTYRPTGGGRIAPDPAWVSKHITTAEVPILGRVTCNTAMMPQLRAALEEVVQVGLADEINPGEYAGCYYPRFIAGSTTLSNHSFGLALDMNVPGNLRGTVGEMDRGIVAIFKKWGFAWGGDWGYTDPMHFELARIVNPG